MPSVILEIIIIAILMLANALFAMSEIAIISSRKGRLQERADKGDRGARAALALADDPSRFLSTVQICITLIGIFAGAFGGATLSEHLAAVLRRVPYVAQYAEALSLGFVVLVITYVTLVVGELAPKRIALNNAERIAGAVAPLMLSLSRIAGPVVSLLSVSTEGIFRMLGLRPSTEPPVTEEEVKQMIEQGTRVGVFEPTEQKMVERVFRLGDRDVNSLMTPRPEIAWLDPDESPEENQRKIVERGFSRYVVSSERLDNVLGIALAKDLLAQSVSSQAIDIRSVLRPALFLPEGIPALTVLERFREARSHIGLVVDEYGSVQGLVTMDNILEAIVGDIPQEEESAESMAVQREDGSWLLDGRLSMDEFRDIFKIEEELPGEAEGYFQTIGGFMSAYLGKIPSTGDHFEWEGVRFEVVDMDERRVDKVLVVPGKQAEVQET